MDGWRVLLLVAYVAASLWCYGIFLIPFHSIQFNSINQHLQKEKQRVKFFSEFNDDYEINAKRTYTLDCWSIN